jgi:hypothetical protein
MEQPDSGIPVADLVNAVRAELEKAAVDARDQRLQFEVKDVQLELQVATTGTRTAEGGLKLWVVTIGGKGSRENAATHKVTLNLGAVTADGTKFRVSDVAEQPIRQQ